MENENPYIKELDAMQDEPLWDWVECIFAASASLRDRFQCGSFDEEEYDSESFGEIVRNLSRTIDLLSEVLNSIDGPWGVEDFEGELSLSETAKLQHTECCQARVMRSEAQKASDET